MGRPPTRPKELRDGFYIDVRNKGSKTGIKIRRDTKEEMLRALKEYGKTKEVTALGEKPDGELMENVSPEQFEDMRFENLTVAEKTAEYDMLIDGLQSQANVMKGKLDITGDVEALVKAQEWYQDEVNKANTKYK